MEIAWYLVWVASLAVGEDVHLDILSPQYQGSLDFQGP